MDTDADIVLMDKHIGANPQGPGLRTGFGSTINIRFWP